MKKSASKSPKYKISSEGYFKRTRWFTNSEDTFGIGIDYVWEETKAGFTADLSFLEADCEEEWNSLIEPALSPDEDDFEDVEIEVEYPTPWYFTDPKALTWTLPKVQSKISSDFKIVIAANYIVMKAIELEKANLPNYWSTTQSNFEWKTPEKEPAAKQVSKEHEMMAKLWNSNAWTSDELLDQFMKQEFDMSIEDDTVVFYNPDVQISLSKSGSS